MLREMLLQSVTEPDPLLAMLQWITDRLMQMESEAKVGAEKGKHSSARITYFSGHRVRRFDTRLGTLYLIVPKLRNGGYIPFFVVERKRSEQALIQVVQEAFISGVPTRKIKKLAQALGIETLPASQVSEINKGLNDQVEAFRNRPLEREYPVIWIDALYEKIRVEDRVVNMAVMVVTGINPSGNREILAVEPMYNESEDTYAVLFQKLKQRGLEQVWLVVSHAHAGLQAAIAKSFLGASWQRCRIHFMRNVLSRVPARDKKRFAAKLKQIWLQPDRKSALRLARLFIAEFRQNHRQFFDDPRVRSVDTRWVGSLATTGQST